MGRGRGEGARLSSLDPSRGPGFSSLCVPADYSSSSGAIWRRALVVISRTQGLGSVSVPSNVGSTGRAFAPNWPRWAAAATRTASLGSCRQLASAAALSWPMNHPDQRRNRGARLGAKHHGANGCIVEAIMPQETPQRKAEEQVNKPLRQFP